MKRFFKEWMERRKAKREAEALADYEHTLKVIRIAARIAIEEILREEGTPIALLDALEAAEQRVTELETVLNAMLMLTPLTEEENAIYAQAQELLSEEEPNP